MLGIKLLMNVNGKFGEFTDGQINVGVDNYQNTVCTYFFQILFSKAKMYQLVLLFLKKHLSDKTESVL